MGFTTGGKRLWAHVTRNGRTRNLAVGKAEGRVQGTHEEAPAPLSRRAPVGVYTSSSTPSGSTPRRPQSVGYTITVRRIVRPAASASATAGRGS